LEQPRTKGAAQSVPTAQGEELTYSKLTDPLPDDTLKEPVANPGAHEALAVPTPAVQKAVPKAPGKSGSPKIAEPRQEATKSNPAETQATGAAEPAGNGYVVQVAAVNDRRDAESIAHRLAGKGYPSFVTTPAGGTSHMFRVRIGKYKERHEAELIASRLQKEEQFKAWVTR